MHSSLIWITCVISVAESRDFVWVFQVIFLLLSLRISPDVFSPFKLVFEWIPDFQHWNYFNQKLNMTNLCHLCSSHCCEWMPRNGNTKSSSEQANFDQFFCDFIAKKNVGNLDILTSLFCNIALFVLNTSNFLNYVNFYLFNTELSVVSAAVFEWLFYNHWSFLKCCGHVRHNCE